MEKLIFINKGNSTKKREKKGEYRIGAHRMLKVSIILMIAFYSAGIYFYNRMMIPFVLLSITGAFFKMLTILATMIEDTYWISAEEIKISNLIMCRTTIYFKEICKVKIKQFENGTYHMRVFYNDDYFEINSMKKNAPRFLETLIEKRIPIEYVD